MNMNDLQTKTTDELIAEAEARLPEWAVARAKGALVEGAQLPTKDGRIMGNAHIIKIAPGLHDMPSLNYLVLTDAGNTFVMSEIELRDRFHPPEYVGEVHDIVGKFWRHPEPLVDVIRCAHPSMLQG